MKLTFVIHSLGMGGAERVLCTLSSYALSIGHEIDIIVFDGNNSFYEFANGINIRYIQIAQESHSIFGAIVNNLKRVASVRKELQAINPDAVISFLTDVNIVSILAAKSCGKKVLACEHSSYDYVKSRLWKFLRKKVYPLADCVSVLTKDDLQNYGWLKNAAVLPNPLFEICEKEHRKEKIVLGVGRLVYEKGFERLINAFSYADTKDWKLVIVGDGNMRVALQEQIDKSDKKDNMILVGAQKDVRSYYQRAALFVLSSRIEGFSMAICEAMAYNCVPISFDCKSGPSEIITNNIDGILVEEGNEKALANEISRLINDDITREKMSKATISAAKRYEVSKIFQILKNLINPLSHRTSSHI